MMDSLNNDEEMRTTDQKSVRFHTTFKSIARMLIKYLPFGDASEDQYAPQLKGNARVFYEIIKEWMHLDTRQHRKDILAKPLLIGTFIYFFDSDFREVLNFMAWRLLQRQDELIFPPHHLDPGTWTKDDDNRVTPGCGISKEAVVRIQENIVVLSQQLPVRNYWLTIEPEKARYFAIDSNRPIWCGDGWGYPILIDYGSQEGFNKNVLLGDLS